MDVTEPMETTMIETELDGMDGMDSIAVTDGPITEMVSTAEWDNGDGDGMETGPESTAIGGGDVSASTESAAAEDIESVRKDIDGLLLEVQPLPIGDSEAIDVLSTDITTLLINGEVYRKQIESDHRGP